jgi:hypothetical protein
MAAAEVSAEPRPPEIVHSRAVVDHPTKEVDQRGEPETAPLVPPVGAVGTAGGSARLEYEKRHHQREERIDQRWGRLAGVVKFLADDPQTTIAWAKGSEGERRLAAQLLVS